MSAGATAAARLPGALPALEWVTDETRLLRLSQDFSWFSPVLKRQLEGKRAGFINKEFDLMFMEKLVTDPLWVTRYSVPELVELTGTQGVELLNWLTCRGALSGDVTKVHSNYHIPISNTASGLLAMQVA